MVGRLINKSTGKGRVGLISGAAAGGIGSSTALLWAAEGAKVVITDIPQNEAYGKELVAKIKASGVGDAHWVPLDVTKEEQWEAAIAETERVFGPLDVLMNCAGGYGTEPTPLEDKPMSEWRFRMDLNLDGTFLGTKYAIQSMKKNTAAEYRSIINISSTTGQVAYARGIAYGTSKGGVRLFTKHAAVYCAEQKYPIRVNSIHPGVILTQGMVDRNFKGDRAAADAWTGTFTPMGHGGEPDDIGHMATFLASNESKYCTGAEFTVDGGWTSH